MCLFGVFMLRRLLAITAFLLSISTVWADGQRITGDFQAVNLSNALYFADRSIDPSSFTPPVSPASFLAQKQQASTVDRVNGGAYWLHVKLQKPSDISQWVINISDSIIDTIVIYQYGNGEIKKTLRGYLHDYEYPLSYAASFTADTNDEVEFLVYIESRYFTYIPKVDFQSLEQFKRKQSFRSFVVVACFGAIFILASYNFVLGAFIKDKSNMYYAGYLLFSIFAWLGAFNAFSQFAGWTSYWFLIPPFFLTVACNLLYVIHFLDLNTVKPNWAKWAYRFVAITVGCTFVMPLMSMGQYMLLYGLVNVVWLLGALFAGISRWRDGFRPARFFVVAFAILALGVLASAVPLFVASFEVKDNYLITLVAQTIDMLILSLALADRVNVLRDEKETALKTLISTESWAFEKEQDANAKLQQALDISEQENQRKSDFLRMVSHELRTPLYSIISSIEQWHDMGDERAQKELLSYMSYGGARLRMQVDNLVLLTETDDDELQATERPFYLSDVLSSLKDVSAGLVNDAVELELRCDDSVPECLMGDAYLFGHMLRTVLENACKYTEHGKVGVYLQWSEGVLAVQVIDTGCGMTRDQERTMFNDFIQVSRGLERNSEGLGIGLTVCYRIAEVLGADLNIKSQLGEGTQVIISVPMPEDKQAAPSVALPNKKAEVLIVEDNIVNAQILMSLVQLLGGVATTVASGQEALTILEQQNFDLIFMDIQMPVMDGITATRWIRHRGVKTPIVAVTANSDIGVRTKCIEVGMNDFLVKPVRRSDIQRVMERQLGVMASE